MGKRRGKQPVKPNMREALKERQIRLKGEQYSSMNIPMVFRRTFDWNADSVVFRPVNRRSFVVFRGDTDRDETEEWRYTVIHLDTEDLPWYPENRVVAKEGDRSKLEELRESLTALSLTDRYVIIEVKKPEDRALDHCLREDLEHLSSELGYSYCASPDCYRCTFRFPVCDDLELLRRSARILSASIEVMESCSDRIFGAHPVELMELFDELSYSVKTSETLMDREYTDALNRLWDLPQTEPAGIFLLTQVCERAHDEIEFVTDACLEVMGLLKDCDEDIGGLLLQELGSMWRTSFIRSLEVLGEALSTIDMEDDDAVSICLRMIREHRKEKQERSSVQDLSISGLANRMDLLISKRDVKGPVGPLSRKGYIGSVELLFGINRSSARISDLAKVFATKRLYLVRSVR